VPFAPDQIDAAIKSAVPPGLGFGGQCAAFAVVLNRVLGGDGVYLCADGQHYQYVEHVALLIDGEIYDASGRIDRERLADYADPEDGAEPDLLEVGDDSVRGLVDATGGGLTPPLDEGLLEMRLRRALPLPSLRP
jgi:hypothetical protein